MLKRLSLFWLQDVADASLQLQRRRSSPLPSVQMGYTGHRAVSRRAGARVARRHRGEDAGYPDPIYASAGVALISCVRPRSQQLLQAEKNHVKRMVLNELGTEK